MAMMRSNSDLARQAEAVAEQIYPLLSGQGFEVQGAVIADLVARYIAGHFVAATGDDDKEAAAAATAEMRESLLAMHIEFVRALVPSAEAEILKRARKGAS